MPKVILAATVLSATVQFAMAQSVPITGTWKLVSFDTEIQTSGERRQVYGRNPNGYLVLTADGRIMALITAEGRKAGESDADRSALSRTMIAYSGMYRVEGDKLTTKVDVSWNEAWNGTEQVRFVSLSGNRLDITSAWSPAANLPGNPMSRGVLTWERAK